MKSKIFVLVLILVFTNISHTLAYTFTSNTLDSSIYINTTKYFCNQTTNSCELTNRTDIPTYTKKEDCISICNKVYITTSYLPTTTTKLQYISNTNTNYQYIPTTTTKPSYISNTNYINYQYTPTTTKLQYISNTNFSNVNYNTTTTKLSYISNTSYINYQYIPPTTTKPSYILNMANTNLRYIPTTTTKLQYTLSPITNFSNISYYTTTTKPIYAISRSIDLSKAVTITTLPLLIANIDKCNLMINTKDDEVKIQTITVGETKKPSGPLIIVVLEDSEYALGLPNYIERKATEGYQVKLEKLSTIGKRPEDMRAYFRKMKESDPNFKFAVIPIDYLSGMVTNTFGTKIAISDYYYCKLDKEYSWTGLYEPNIFISRANREMLERNYTKLTQRKMLITFPIMRYMHKIYNEGCWYADLKKADPSRLGDVLKQQAQNLGINVKTLYETRGIEPSVNKPDLSLNLPNILSEAADSNFILASNTAEYTYIDFKHNKKLVETWHPLLTTAIYKFDNGNNSADQDEIQLEQLTDFSDINTKDRIGGLFFEGNDSMAANNKFTSYVTHRADDIAIRTAKYYGEIPENWILGEGPGLFSNNEDGSGLVPSYVSDIRLFAEGIFTDETVSEALWNIGKRLIDTFKSGNKTTTWDYIVYGDPAKTLQDTIEQPNASITSSNIKEENIINIPKGKFETDFIIKNIGKLDVTYSFDKNELLDINPISGTVLVSNETKVNLKILNTTNIQSNDNTLNNLKPKSTKLYFRSNAGDKEITINYWDI